MKPGKNYTVTDVETYFQKAGLVDDDYANFHKYRYAYILNILDTLLKQGGEPNQSLLDVGPYYQTPLIRQTFSKLAVNTLGFDKPSNEMREGELHWTADLNHAQLPENPVRHDIILYSEVMEHLYTMPQLVIDFLSNLLSPGGHLIVQTPNAVALHKRINMLMGRNPFDMIDSERQNHFREYTLPELIGILEACGYQVVYSSISNYFNPDRNWAQRAYRRMGNWLTPGLRDGITLVARKD